MPYLIIIAISALLLLLLTIVYRHHRKKIAQKRQLLLQKLTEKRNNIEAILEQNAHIYRQYILHTEKSINDIKALPLNDLTQKELDQIEESLLSAQSSLTELEQNHKKEIQYYQTRLDALNSAIEKLSP